jgi:(2Fe-2S) ferredoxin
METRNITIVSSNNNAQYNIQSSATTLGELKQELAANRIPYDGMVFYEGFSKTEMVNNDSVLPSNISRRGVVTNDLVFMLTPERKNIKSGMDRKECYEYCKNNPELVVAIKRLKGKHYTNVATNELIEFINNHKQPVVKKETKKKITTKCNCSDNNNIIKAILIIADTILNSQHRKEVYTLLNQEIPEKKCIKETPYTPAEINELFDFINE